MQKSRMAAGSAAALTLALAAGVVATGLGGCASYGTYPPAPQSVALNDPNTLSMQQVMAAGLSWVASKYPPGGRDPAAIAMGEELPEAFAVNLPPTTSYRTYERVVASIGRGALPLSEETSHLPTYHVGYVRVRGDEAQVHIIRPVETLSGAGGAPIPQEIKLQLRGGLGPWRVIGSREWQVGSADVPALNYYRRPAEAAKPTPSKHRTPWQTVKSPPKATEPAAPEPATVSVPEKPD
ncbi:MAG: hypothetical protein WD749_04780 [Phycisphaerales bacterium]